MGVYISKSIRYCMISIFDKSFPANYYVFDNAFTMILIVRVRKLDSHCNNMTFWLYID